MASRRAARVVVVVGYEHVQALDVTGPVEVFAHAAREPGGAPCTVVLASRRGGLVTTSSGLSLGTVPLATCARVDTLLVAGGAEAGVRAAAEDVRLLAQLRRLARGARRVGSVCTGAFVLAAAGLLDGHRVATHWAAGAQLAAFRPHLEVDEDAIFVREGRLWTSAGITTGIDMALAMVEEDDGPAVADAVAAQLVLAARRPGFQSQFSTLLAAQRRHGDPMAALVAWGAAHLRVLSVPRLAEGVGLSVRTLHRVCARAGVSPGEVIDRLRGDHARVLLTTTGLGLKEVARECGYGDASALARAFGRRFGLAPGAYRTLHGARSVTPPA